MNMNKEIKKIIIASSCIAVAIVFAAVVHLVGGQPLGKIISPMHIPVFICGLILGWKYGLLVGILTPLVSYMFRGIPPILPTGLGMCLELGTYTVTASFTHNNPNYESIPSKEAKLVISKATITGIEFNGKYIVQYNP